VIANVADDDFDKNVVRRVPAVLTAGTELVNITRIPKMRITINLDTDVVAYFKHQAAETARGYQTLINDALRQYIGLASKTDVLTNLIERVKRLEQSMLR
jgi:uncharacterized protein (DUF4415 family)